MQTTSSKISVLSTQERTVSAKVSINSYKRNVTAKFRVGFVDAEKSVSAKVRINTVSRYISAKTNIYAGESIYTDSRKRSLANKGVHTGIVKVGLQPIQFYITTVENLPYPNSGIDYQYPSSLS